MEERSPIAALPTDQESRPPLSKNQQKKLLRSQRWEAGREDRKVRRKEKTKERRERKRAVRREGRLEAPSTQEGVLEGCDNIQRVARAKSKRVTHDQLPVTLVLDCGFEDYMQEKELVSLCSQVTRSYSEIHKAPYTANLIVSSFGGKMQERFESVLMGHHKGWKHVKLMGDCVLEATQSARKWMSERQTNKFTGAFKKHASSSLQSEDLKEQGEVVYLTSESPHTLTELLPYSTYIIGGLVDHNRHKGICYKKAEDLGLKTAKLPIGDYMRMNSRYVLATNHVVEVMLNWLESGDWGQAFLKALPKRKGGVLKNGDGSETVSASVDADSSKMSASKACNSEEDDNTDETHSEDSSVSSPDAAE